MQADERAYKIIGFLPEDYDLGKGFLGLLEEQAVGLYDPSSKRMMLAKDKPFGFLTRTIIAHELTHALQDQYFDLKRRTSGARTWDANFALTSLVEGDAVASQTEYGHVDDSSDAGAREAPKPEIGDSSKKLLSAPPAMQHGLLDPYLFGLAFVNHFRADKAGWKRVDEIFSDPPISARQVMHPDKYYPRREFPRRIDFPGLTAPVAGTKRCDTTLGELGAKALVETWGIS